MKEQDRNDIYARVYKDVAPKVIMLLVARMKIPRSLAEDAVQTVFVKILEGRSKIDVGKMAVAGDQEQVVNYVTAAAWKYYLNSVRHQKVVQSHEELLLAVLADTPDTEMAQIEERERRLDRLERAIEMLDEPYYSILKKMLREEKPLSRISEDLGISQKGIYTQFKRAREMLLYHLDRIDDQEKG